jgi:cellulose synthase/poly-beta-1,6-N-acetylglucosamine synthase-like glycosyltransferase
LEATFWASTLIVFYVYVGYPIVAYLLSRWVGTPVAKSDVEPSVTVVIAARNEATCIERTIRNKLEQDYPKELLDVIVVSDESTDGTDEIVSRFGRRVVLIRQVARRGKTAALNLGVASAKGEVLVFSDANSLYRKDAVRQLVRNFADESVGYVTGRMVYWNPAAESLVGEGTSAYMRYENFIRRHETRLASVIGVDGGIDAVRRSLYRNMRADQQSDFVLPLVISGEGHRVVYEEQAVLTEETLSDHDSEYHMRVRVSLRAMWALWDNRALLFSYRQPLLAFQIWSHKVARYAAFIPLAVSAISCAPLALHSTFYASILAAGLLLLLLAASVWVRKGRGYRIALVPYYLLLSNVSFAHAAAKFLMGKRQAIWTPRVG